MRLRVLFLGVAVRNGYKAGVEEGAIGQHTRHAFIHRLPLQVAAGERERLCWPPFFLDLDSLLLVVYYSIPLAHHRVFYMRTMVAMCCCYCCCVLSWPLFISWLGATPRLGYIRISETRPSDQPAALLIFIRALDVLCCVVNDLPLLHTLHGQQQLYYSTDNQKKNFLIPLLAECCCCCRVLGRIIPSALEG